eukprot:scaffold665643_cov218-Prasinocladus_malaysianus.AAC.1
MIQPLFAVRSTHAVTEQIVNDILLDQHLTLIQQHPVYDTYEGFMLSGKTVRAQLCYFIF